MLPVQPDNSLKLLFYPRNIAVIGASNTVGKLGYNVFKNLIIHNYQGRLYAVNPGVEYVQGIKAYKDIGDIDDEIDTAIIIVPAKSTPGVIKKCCRKGVKFVINEAAGFSEIGQEGFAIEQEIVQALRNSSTRMVGPNCSGLINTHHNMVQSLGIVGLLRKGNLGVVAQAGVYAAGLLWGFSQTMEFGVIATIGNKLDINETDMLEYLGTDDNIRVISMYLEDIKAGRRFIDVAKEVTCHKPIIALKGGRTTVGLRTAASHTASIAGNNDIYNAVFRQSRVIQAESYRDMFNLSKAFSKQPLPKGPGLLIISYTGAMGVTSTDTCYEKGLRLAELSSASIKCLSQIIPPYVTVKNPVDLTFDQTPAQVAEVINTCAKDDDVSAFVIILQAELTDLYIEKIGELSLCGKPLLISIPARDFVMPSVIKLEELGFPVYDDPETAVHILSKMHWFYEHSLYSKISQ
ncbi:MAG: CoA-binding protein [Dehalococcoidales bacterium]|nr:CoA-binding protein [Dehalococcoidales bacterium]